MHRQWWWLRLQLWQWINVWRTSPLRSTLIPLLWLLLAIVLPAALALAGQHPAAAAMEWVLSFDIPLQLLLAAQVGMAIVALRSRVDTESWIALPARRGLAGRALFIARLALAVRWPLGLALASLLLSAGSPRAAQHLAEMLLLAGFALVGGASFAWLLLGRRGALADHSKNLRGSRARGLPALSWVPLRETSRLMDPRRIALLGIPMLLMAPMESTAQQVLRALAAWLVLLYSSSWLRQAAHTAEAMHRWMPRVNLRAGRLNWYIWRYAILAATLGMLALWLGSRLSAPQPVTAKP